mgnify:CR=1 FL=1
MAINFLNTVNLNKNQLTQAAIESQPNDAAVGATPVAGQIYFNTVSDNLRIYTGAAWEEVGGGVESIVWNNGTYVSITTTGTAANPIYQPDLSAIDGTSNLNTRFLSKDNTWDVPAFDNYSSWTLNGDSGSPQGIASGDTALFTGGTKITTAVSATDTLTISHNTTTRTDTTSTVSGVSFPVIDTITTDTTGHVTAVNVKTVTVPDVTVYDLLTAPTGTAVRLSGNLTGDDDVTISGTTGQTAMSRISASELRVALTDDVTIIDDLNVGGVITQTGASSTTGVNNGAITASTALLLTADNTAIKVGMEVTGTGIPTNITIVTVTDAKNFVLSGVITIANTTTITFTEVNSFGSALDMNNNRISEVKTGVLGTDGVNLAQVELLVAGVGVFKGGYDAATGLTVPGGNEIDGANNIALDKGDYFVVTVAGSAFFTIALEPGDFIFAETAITANSSPPVGDYIYVRADDNVAGAGATDNATQKGVSGFDSENFTVTSNGWVQLKRQSNPYGISVLLTGGIDSGGETTFTVDVTTAARFGTGALAANCIATVKETTSSLIVYPEVTGNGTGSLDFKFVPVVSTSAGFYTAYITHI